MIADITRRMIAFSEGNLPDINHFMMVWAYARTIGLEEGLDDRTQSIIEIAALVHDIACPLCREKYGSTAGKLQEQEGVTLAETFLSEFDMDAEMKERICYLVGHHHTLPSGRACSRSEIRASSDSSRLPAALTHIEGMDYQILIEADYLVNAIENRWSRDNVTNFVSRYFRTQAGMGIAKDLFKV